ncbi:MAG: hypothetical protein AAF639_03460 [Chloroflexota bacterium]
MPISTKVTQEAVQRYVSEWLFLEVSYMMAADIPSLDVVDGQQIWRVPAVLTAPHVGRVGHLGDILVNGEDGEILDTEQIAQALIDEAEKLESHIPDYKPRTETPSQHVVGSPSQSIVPMGDPLEIIARTQQPILEAV